jgi:RNase P/RNase MRP subunit p30
MDITLFKTEKNLYFKEINSKKDIKEDKDINGYLINSSENEIRSIIASLESKKDKKLIAIKAKDDFFNRRIIETCRVNFIVSPELNQEKDTLKQRASGFNHVLAKEAVKKGISLLINFSEIIKQDKKRKAIIISRIMQNIKICRKTNCKIKIVAFAKNKEELRTENELKAFLSSLGASSQQVAEACKFFS